MLLPSLVQVSESISGSVVPLAMFITLLTIFHLVKSSCLVLYLKMLGSGDLYFVSL